MKLWIDDVKEMPPYYTHWAKTGEDAISLISRNINEIEEISFDHDLGSGIDGSFVVRFIEKLVYSDKLKRFKWNIHSSNPVGRKYIELVFKSIEKKWNESL